MYTIIGAVLLVMVPVGVSAQNYGNMSRADMQKIMQQAQQMQACVAKVDQGELKAIENRSNQMQAEFKTLCDEGKRDEAQKKAIEYSKEMARNPALKQLRECGEKYQGMMPEQKSMMGEDVDYSSHHVCDDQ